MTNQQRDVFYQSPPLPPPYADPVTILTSPAIPPIIVQTPHVFPTESVSKKYLPSLLFFILFLYMTA